MKSQQEQSTIFRFDETSSFADNCEAFLTWIEAADPEMTSILRDNWAALVAIVNEGSRDSKVRGEFNAAIATELDALITKNLKKDGAL